MLTLLPKKTNDEKLDPYIKECRTILLTSLKEELLKDVIYAISRELKHFFDMTNLKTDLENILNKTQIDGLQSYLYHSDYLDHDDYKKHPKYANIFQSEYEEYVTLLIGALESGLTEKQFVQTSKILFESDDVEWDEAYGGKEWGKICQAWLNLYNAKTLENIMVWIDHIYDLEHNTGSILNKMASYSHDFNVTKMLDLKREADSAYQIMHKVSPQMKALALPVIKKTKKQGEHLFIPQKDKLTTLKDKIIYSHGHETYYKLYNYSKPETFLEKYIEITKNHDKLHINFNNLKFNEEYVVPVDRYNFAIEYQKLIIANNIVFMYKHDKKLLVLRDLVTYSISKETNINNVKTIEEINKIIKGVENTYEIDKIRVKESDFNLYLNIDENPFAKYLYS